jgi:hypothetical protein
MAWLADRGERTARAAAWLGVLTVLKPFFALFGIFLLWRRQWRAIAIYGTVIACGYLLGLWFVGFDGYRDWFASLGDVSWQSHVYNASVWGLADRWFNSVSRSMIVNWTPLVVAPRFAQASGVLLAFAVLVGLWRSVNRTDLDQAYALIGLAAILLSPLGWLHYLPVLLAPLTNVLGRRPSPLLWPLGLLAAIPTPFLVGRTYGPLGTATIGLWAFTILGGTFLLAARRSAQHGEDGLVSPS